MEVRRRKDGRFTVKREGVQSVTSVMKGDPYPSSLWTEKIPIKDEPNGPEDGDIRDETGHVRGG